MQQTSTLLDRLKDVHTFPCTFTFKVIGTNSPEFISQVAQAAVNVVGAPANTRVDTRESRKGNHLAVTLSVDVDSAETIVRIYALLQNVPGLRYLL